MKSSTIIMKPTKPAIKRREFQTRLLRWFDEHGRKHLPWQENKTPYRVWVSEIMLQQTQVATVIPYYARFMQQFPDVVTLAQAPDDAVMHAWAGLGYYSRARNLHRAAKMVVSDFAGEFPDSIEGLTQLPGIGESTAGAIRSIAFNLRAPILDGNVKRVLTRLAGITEPVNDKTVENTLWTLADYLTPTERVADYTQAIMDLGATFCTRSKPSCATCPFQRTCVAHAQGIAESLPAKKAARELPTRQATFLVLIQNGQVLLEKRPDKGIWGGLWCFPVLEGKQAKRTVLAHCQQTFNLTPAVYEPLPAFRHTFSHYHLTIHPVKLKKHKKYPVDKKSTRAQRLESVQQIWYNLDDPATIGLPKPVLQIVRELT